MKIAIVSILFSKDRGGAIGIAHRQAIELKKRGHDVFVFTGTEENKESWTDEDGIKIYRSKIKELRYIFRNYFCLFNRRINKKFKEFLKNTNPEIVHFHNLYYQFPLSLIKRAKRNGSRVFMTLHDVMTFSYEKLMPKNGTYLYKLRIFDHLKNAGRAYNPFRNLFTRHYLNYTDKIFSVSNSLKKLLEINGIKGKVETIHNGIDVQEWQISEGKIESFEKKYNLSDKKVIFFGGRLSGAKGGKQILESIALIKKDFKNIVLLVAGEKNEYFEEMGDLVKRLDIENNIVFLGWLREDDLKAAYHRADISVFPSLCFETFGMVNLEAMACKKPVVSSFFGGPIEVVVDGVTGYLIDPNNVELMAGKIMDLIKNPEKAKKFGEAGYQRVKDFFSLDKQIEEILKWYKYEN